MKYFIKKLNFKDIVFIVLTVVLILFLFNQCSKAKENDRLYNQNLKSLSDTIQTYKDKYDREVSIKANYIVKSTDDLKKMHQENGKLRESLRKFKNVNSTTQIKTVTKIEKVLVPIVKTDTIDGLFYTKFSDSSDYYSIRGYFGKDTFELESLEVPNIQTIVVGEYKPSFFKKSTLSTSVTNSNPYVTVEYLNTQQVQVPKKWYEKGYITIPLGVVGGVLLWEVVR